MRGRHRQDRDRWQDKLSRCSLPGLSTTEAIVIAAGALLVAVLVAVLTLLLNR